MMWVWIGLGGTVGIVIGVVAMLLIERIATGLAIGKGMGW